MIRNIIAENAVKKYHWEFFDPDFFIQYVPQYQEYWILGTKTGCCYAGCVDMSEAIETVKAMEVILDA